MRRLALLAVCLLGATACGSTPTDSTAATAATTTSVAVIDDALPYRPLIDVPARTEPDPFPPTGVAVEFQQLSWYDELPTEQAIADATLTGCRRRRAGIMTFDFVADAATDGPAALWLGYAASLESDTGSGVPSLVTLDAPGPFSVTLDLHRTPLWNGDLQRIENGNFGDVDVYADGFSGGSIGACTADSPSEFLRFAATDDLVQPALTAPEGTAEWYAQRVDVTDPDADLAPFANFVQRDVLVGFDRLHIAPGHQMVGMTLDFFPDDIRNDDGVDVERFGECVEVRTRYVLADAGEAEYVHVSELFGCAPDPSVRDNPVLLETTEPSDLAGIDVGTDGEFVAVVGPADLVEAVAADLVRAPFDDV
jgi:hypothetical protein